METYGPIYHAYGFVGDAGEDAAGLIAGLGAVDGVRFAARTIGAYDAVVVATVSGLAALQAEVLPAVAAAGARNVRWSLAVGPDLVLPKRFVAPLGAFVRLQVDDVEGVLDELLDTFSSLNDQEGFGFGAAIVTGDGYDVLVDLGAPSDGELVELVFRLRGVPGVGRTETTLYSFEGNAFHEG